VKNAMIAWKHCRDQGYMEGVGYEKKVDSLVLRGVELERRIDVYIRSARWSHIQMMLVLEVFVYAVQQRWSLVERFTSTASACGRAYVRA
jgi:hypothetical protein